jgi:hypothetical protein
MSANINADALLLVIAYKRFENVKAIINIAKESGVNRVLVHIDKARDNDPANIEAQASFCDEMQNKHIYPQIEVVITNRNVGCAVNVISGVDKAFEESRYCFILEDDCIPTGDFFKFASESQGILDADKDLWLVCGTQFAPKSLVNGLTTRSNYALTWGWYTNSKKWKEIRESLFSNTRGDWHQVSIHEQRYWTAGRKRALDGITDVWDTILVSKMRELGKFSLLPAECLINNIGDDEAATHTILGSSWLHQKTGSFESPIQIADEETNQHLDKWLRNNVFRISIRHAITTLISRLLDSLRLRKRKFNNSLIARLSQNPL